jgi:hypothetical protein
MSGPERGAWFANVEDSWYFIRAKLLLCVVFFPVLDLQKLIDVGRMIRKITAAILT